MSNELLHEPLALAARSLDLHESEQSCLFHFDVSAQEWLSRVDPHADVEEFVTAFGAYLEQEKERVMRLPRTLLASDLRFLSEDRGAILSRLDSTLKARRSLWLLVARAKAEKIPTPAEPIISAASHKGSGDSNAKVSNTRAVRSEDLNQRLATISGVAVSHSAGADQSQPSDSAHMPRVQEAQQTKHSRKVKKRVRRTQKYEQIDKALREFSAAQPKNHEEVFRFLDDRKVTIPNRKPFKTAGGWLKGFQRNRYVAGAWLSQEWGRLSLPPFPRGPKK